ncbi:unnamed protein product [Phytomonas sp. EM1]|nr:unnamed protein product [Phytomonas sp. EM1]|eukprot:CCW63598.1 unnamed protein product [Phytomonas sp. isolate EM1]
MLCAISNRVPQNPVITKRGGCLFERSLIEKYIDEYSRCPVTGEPLTREDLLPVRGGTAGGGGGTPPILGACSVLELLERMRIEWDAVMLEQYSFRLKLAQMEQELAHALQQYEAACRVIATLTMECDELRQERQRHSNGNGESKKNEEEAVVVSSPVLSLIDSQEAMQRKKRKQRKQSLIDLPSQLSDSFVEVSQVKVIPNNTGSALCLSIANDLLYSAGTTNLEILQYDMTKKCVLATGGGHHKHVHTITTAHEGARIISASEDHTVKIWGSEPGQLTCEGTLRYANGASALSRRLIGETYALVGSADGSLYISNIEVGEQAVVATGARDSGITCAELHPYASLAAIGTTNGELMLWNVKLAAPDTVLSLRTDSSAHASELRCYPNSIDLHPDCVTLATGLSDGRVLLWDLRKIDEPVAEIMTPNDTSGNSILSPASVAFEESSGIYLAVGMCDLKLYYTAKLLESAPIAECVLDTLSTDHSKVSGVCWPRSSVMAVSCMDGVVRIFNA